jgi:uncharacterized protein (UPF0332 family)
VPSARAHQQQAADNESFYRQQLGGASAARSDWAMTAIFYTAVHEVQALIVRKGWTIRDHGQFRIPETHGQRLQAIKRYCGQIEGEYRDLKTWSEGGRYNCQTYTPQDLQNAERVLASLRNKIQAVP